LDESDISASLKKIKREEVHLDKAALRKHSFSHQLSQSGVDKQVAILSLAVKMSTLDTASWFTPSLLAG